MKEINCGNDWWKWGPAENRLTINHYPKLKTYLEDKWKISLDEAIPAPSSFLSTTDEKRAQQVEEIFRSQLPEIKYSSDAVLRLKKSSGKSCPDLLNALNNVPFAIPDGVAFPKNHEEVSAFLRVASENIIQVIPFGGGSNVVRAFNLPDGNIQPRIVLDLADMNNLIQIDKYNHTATFQCGIYGPALEEILNVQGFTMGHFPQSFQYSTLGGWIVTRSAGQESSAYGRIEDIMISLKAATPAGTISTSKYEGDAEGINIKGLFLGSEGVLGVVTEATVRIHPLPKNKRWYVGIFPSFESGVGMMRELIQEGIHPSLVRFSDEVETNFFSFLSVENSKLKTSLQNIFFKLKGLKHPSVMMIRFDGEEESCNNKRIAKKIARKHGGVYVGESIGKKWELNRFTTPYLREDLMERGILIDTFETVVHWDKLNSLRIKLQNRFHASDAFHKDKGILLAHVSHVYNSCACIYFTYQTIRNRGKDYEQWKELKTIANDVLFEEGAAVSHHHSVGIDHQKPYLLKTDELTKTILRTIKQKVDPNHILNPGKLFDEQN